VPLITFAWINRSVERQRANLPPADFAEFLATIRSVADKFTARLLSVPSGTERGDLLHRLMEQTQSAAAGVSVSCRKGCASCCHYEVEITEDEAAVLAGIVRSGMAIDHSRLRVQAARERKGAEWNEVLRPDNRCAFLGEDGGCRVYEQRPSACRRHLVTSPADACSTPGQPIAPVEVFMTEILLSAAFSLDGVRHASLSKMLLASLAAA